MAGKGDSADEDGLLGEVGARIRSVRERAGMTQQEFAAAAGISQSYVWRMEAGRLNLSVRTLARVALALGEPMSRLLDGISADPSSLTARGYRWAQGSDPRPSRRKTVPDG